MRNIPKEITILIFKLLDDKSLYTVHKVCRAWREYAIYTYRKFRRDEDLAFYDRITFVGIPTGERTGKIVGDLCMHNKFIMIKKLLYDIFQGPYSAIIFCYGAKGACEGGHLELFKLMLSYDPTSPVVRWGLSGACNSGQFQMVKFILDNYQINDYIQYIYHQVAHKNGFMDIAEILTNNGTDQSRCHYTCYMCKKGS